MTYKIIKEKNNFYIIDTDLIDEELMIEIKKLINDGLTIYDAIIELNTQNKLIYFDEVNNILTI